MSGVQLREDVFVIRESATEALLQANVPLRLRNLNGPDWTLLSRLQKGLSAPELAQVRAQPRHGRLLEAFSASNLLKAFDYRPLQDPALERQADWLAYFVDCPADKLDALANFRVLVLGCGGTGAVAASHLARAGFRKLTLVDGAQVDEPDLNRQLPFTREDLDRSKASALADHLTRLSSRAEFIAIDRMVTSPGDVKRLLELSKPDFVLNCADKPLGRILPWVSRACAGAGIPVLFGGVGLEHATLGPLLTDEQAKLSYANEMERADTRIRTTGENQILRASLAFTNSLCAVQLAFELFRYATGVSEPLTLNRTVDWDLMSGTMRVRREWCS